MTLSVGDEMSYGEALINKTFKTWYGAVWDLAAGVTNEQGRSDAIDKTK